MATQPTNSGPPGRTAIRASLACVQCRSRHLRCDAGTPTCARCQQEGSQCTYMKSRRGARARVNAPQAHPETQKTLPAALSSAHSPVAPPRSQLPGLQFEKAQSIPNLVSDNSTNSSITSSPSGDEHTTGSSASLNQDCLLDLYYIYFHTSQPVVLPRQFIGQKVSENAPGIKAVLSVMRYIGSLYAPKVRSDPLEDQVKIALAESESSPNGYEVQALVLYSTAVYWCNDIQRASELLDTATSKALALGMNTQSFATNFSGGDPVLAESWRRTWWQLYLTDAHIAATNHAITFRTSQKGVPTAVELPCEEEEYSSGVSDILHLQANPGLIDVNRKYHLPRQ